MTAVLIVGAVASFLLDWQANHLLNPTWPPHAKFHGALLLFMEAGVSLTGLWLLWRRSKEPRVAITATALMSTAFWSPLFFVTSILPGSSAWAGNPNTMPHIAGHIFYPNLLVAAICLIATGISCVLASTDSENAMSWQPVVQVPRSTESRQ
jgi:hypothetical protein